MRAFKTMIKTELKLSLRGMDMFIFAICAPLVVLVLLGILYGDKPAFEGAGYTFLEQSFGALTTISICAGGVMGLPLVVSEYRSRHILKRYQVTPVSPAVILLVQVSIYTLYAVVSLVSLYLTAALFFGYRFNGSWTGFLGGYLLVLVSMFSIGMMVGGIAPDAKTAGVIASLLYFPMLIFSGATLPYEVMPGPLRQAAGLLPLTQGIKLLKAASLGLPAESVRLPILLMAAIAGVSALVSLRCFKWELGPLIPALPAAVQHVPPAAPQYLHVDGLGHMGGHARLHSRLHILRKSVGRHGDDGNNRCVRPLHAADGSGGFVPVHFRHLDVHQDGVVGAGSRLRKCPHRLGSVLAHHGFGPIHGEQLAEYLSIDLVVLRH